MNETKRNPKKEASGFKRFKPSFCNRFGETSIEPFFLIGIIIATDKRSDEGNEEVKVGV